jgi:RNA-binding protein NOB1
LGQTTLEEENDDSTEISDEELDEPSPEELPSERSSTPPLYEDPSDDDDGEGEWITPTNVSLHKSQALQLIPSKGGSKARVITGCMTTDFAMQNVLLHMGQNLVGVDGKKIDKIKTWVLRCHACFKCVLVYSYFAASLTWFLEFVRILHGSFVPLAGILLSFERL